MKYRIFTGINYDKQMLRLEELSKRGEHLKKVHLLTIYEFEQGEKYDYKYRIVFDKKLDDELIEYYKVSGWKIIMNNWLGQVLRGDENSVEIFTDIDSEIEIYKKRIKNSVVYTALSVITFCLLLIFGKGVLSESLGAVISGLIGAVLGTNLSVLIWVLYKYYKIRKKQE